MLRFYPGTVIVLSSDHNLPFSECFFLFTKSCVGGGDGGAKMRLGRGLGTILMRLLHTGQVSLGTSSLHPQQSRTAERLSSSLVTDSDHH